MNERLILLRERLGLTQEAFGERIGLTKSSISLLESGRRSLQEQTIKLICHEFGVSESWLRNGQGEMLIDLDEDDPVNRLMLGDNEFAKQVFRSLAKLSPESWELFRQFVDTLKKGAP